VRLSASTPSPTVLEQLLEHDGPSPHSLQPSLSISLTPAYTLGTDVDLKNRIEGDTPLHLAVKLENEDARLGVVEMLLDAGADPRSVPSIPSPSLSTANIDAILSGSWTSTD
jgi:ankyrin repeat protein